MMDCQRGGGLGGKSRSWTNGEVAVGCWETDVCTAWTCASVNLIHQTGGQNKRSKVGQIKLRERSSQSLIRRRSTDLLLNLSPELVRMGNPAESLKRPACTAYDHAPISQHSTEARLIDTDAFDL